MPGHVRSRIAGRIRLVGTFTTGTTTSPPLTAAGAPVDTSGAVPPVAAGTVTGGGLILGDFSGLDVLVTTGGTLA